MLTSKKEGSNFIQNLPPEILILIFSNLTILELTKVQKTCKAWYAISQNTPTLWRNSEPFFKTYEEVIREIPKFVQGVQTLSKLSAGKLDKISFNFGTGVEDEAEIASFLESIPDLDPTSLQLSGILDSDKYLPVVGRCKSLRELDLEIHDDDTPFKDNVFKDCPIQEAKLEKLTLNQNSFKEWRSDESCLSVSSSIKTFILDEPGSEELDIAQALDFLYHCRQSLEKLHFTGWGIIFIRGVTGLHQEIVLPNLVEACFALLGEEPWTDNGLEPFHCLKCPQIQELILPSKYFLKLFDSVESVKDVRLDWDVDDLEEMFRTFPNIETFESRLHSEDMLRSLVDLVPKQLKHLKLTIDPYTCHNVDSSKQSTIYPLLELVKKRSTSTHSESVISLCQEGAIEFCYITMYWIGPTECRLGDDASVSMCKRNFVEVFTELSKMEAFDTSTQTSSIILSD